MNILILIVVLSIILIVVFIFRKKTSCQKHSIFDFFEVDLGNIPDSSFTCGSTTVNSVGSQVVSYEKKLNYKECGIFDFVEVKKIGESGSRNILFKSYSPNRADFSKIKALIKQLYAIYGKDENNNADYCNKDRELYYDDKFYQLFGRNWARGDKHNHPIWLSREEDCISLVMFDVDKWNKL